MRKENQSVKTFVLCFMVGRQLQRECKAGVTEGNFGWCKHTTREPYFKNETDICPSWAGLLVRVIRTDTTLDLSQKAEKVV